MKLSLTGLFVFCLILSSCNHTPKQEEQATTTNDTVGYGETLTGLDSLVLKEPITVSAKHYFSDSASMDSFVATLAAGTVVFHNSVQEYCHIRIYQANGSLLFEDSVSPATFYNSDMTSEDNSLKDLQRGIAAVFAESNFSTSGQQDAIKNASAEQIKNMAAWNEAINDSTRTIFSYYGPGIVSYVGYVPKLKKGAVAVQLYSEDDD